MTSQDKTTIPGDDEKLSKIRQVEQLFPTAPNSKMDDSLCSESDKKFFTYASIGFNCRRKVQELQIDKYDARRLENRETKAPNEVSKVFGALCVIKEVFGTPPCLHNYENISFLTKYFTARERRQLFEQLVKSCAYIGENRSNHQSEYLFYDTVALEQYLKLKDYDDLFIEKEGSFKKFPVFAQTVKHDFRDETTGKLLQGDNLQNFTEEDASKLKILIEKMRYEKQFNYVMNEYENIPTLPPSYMVYAYGVSFAYCKQHFMKCMRDTFYKDSQNISDEDLVEKFSIGNATECLASQPCFLKASSYLDYTKSKQNK
nr:unnamed protein product [Naegleria fowleri]